MSGRHPAESDRGSVSVELALALPTAVTVLVLCLSAVHAAGVSTAVHAGALAGAREAAMGVEAPEAVARRVAGPEAVVEVVESGGWIEVQVTAPARWPWPALRARVALPVEP